MESLTILTEWLSYIGLLSLIVIPTILYYASNNFTSYWKKRGLNGPPVIPLLGNMFSIQKPIPLLQIEYQKKYGKFFGMFQGSRPAVCVHDPEIIKNVLVKDFPIFRNRIATKNRDKVMSLNLVAVRDERWKRIRSILSPMFTTSKLKKMEPLMSQCIESMIRALERKADSSDNVFHVHNMMGNFTMDVIAKCAFATDTNAHDGKDNQFVISARQIFQFNLLRTVFFFILPSFLLRFLSKLKMPYFHTKGASFFKDISYHLVRQRRNNPNHHVDDMLELMIRAEHGKEKSFEKEDEFDAHHVNVGKEELEQEQNLFKEIIGSKYLDEDEIVAQSIVFFLAGYETTASTLNYCIYHLAANPDIQDRLYQEVRQILDRGDKLEYKTVMTLNYLDAVLSETLRICPPALTLSREAASDYYIPEYNFTLKKGEGILIPIYAIHHDPEYYKNPEEFDPERFMPENREQIIPYTYLPFGGGPRNCIGMRFALSEAKLGLARMITEFEFCKSDKTPKLDIQMSLFILKTTPIYVGVRRRKQKL